MIGNQNISAKIEKHLQGVAPHHGYDNLFAGNSTDLSRLVTQLKMPARYQQLEESHYTYL